MDIGALLLGYGKTKIALAFNKNRPLMLNLPAAHFHTSRWRINEILTVVGLVYFIEGKQ